MSDGDSNPADLARVLADDARKTAPVVERFLSSGHASEACSCASLLLERFDPDSAHLLRRLAGRLTSVGL